MHAGGAGVHDRDLGGDLLQRESAQSLNRRRGLGVVGEVPRDRGVVNCVPHDPYTGLSARDIDRGILVVVGLHGAAGAGGLDQIIFNIISRDLVGSGTLIRRGHERHAELRAVIEREGQRDPGAAIVLALIFHRDLEIYGVARSDGHVGDLLGAVGVAVDPLGDLGVYAEGRRDGGRRATAVVSARTGDGRVVDRNRGVLGRLSVDIEGSAGMRLDGKATDLDPRDRLGPGIIICIVYLVDRLRLIVIERELDHGVGNARDLLELEDLGPVVDEITRVGLGAVVRELDGILYDVDALEDAGLFDAKCGLISSPINIKCIDVAGAGVEGVDAAGRIGHVETYRVARAGVQSCNVVFIKQELGLKIDVDGPHSRIRAGGSVGVVDGHVILIGGSIGLQIIPIAAVAVRFSLDHAAVIGLFQARFCRNPGSPGKDRFAVELDVDVLERVAELISVNGADARGSDALALEDEHGRQVDRSAHRMDMIVGDVARSLGLVRARRDARRAVAGDAVDGPSDLGVVPRGVDRFGLGAGHRLGAVDRGAHYRAGHLNGLVRPGISFARLHILCDNGNSCLERTLGRGESDLGGTVAGQLQGVFIADVFPVGHDPNKIRRVGAGNGRRLGKREADKLDLLNDGRALEVGRILVDRISGNGVRSGARIGREREGGAAVAQPLIERGVLGVANLARGGEHRRVDTRLGDGQNEVFAERVIRIHRDRTAVGMRLEDHGYQNTVRNGDVGRRRTGSKVDIEPFFALRDRNDIMNVCVFSIADLHRVGVQFLRDAELDAALELDRIRVRSGQHKVFFMRLARTVYNEDLKVESLVRVGLSRSPGNGPLVVGNATAVEAGFGGPI